MELIIDRMKQHDDLTYVDITNWRIRRVGNERKIFGTQINKIPLGNDVTFELTASMKTGAGYFMLPYKLSKPICDLLANDTYFYPEWAAASDFEVPFTCPVVDVRILSRRENAILTIFHFL